MSEGGEQISLFPTRAPDAAPRALQTCSNVALQVDRAAARRYMVEWIAKRAVEDYRRTHGKQD
jgi:hypothetical protein